MGEWRLLSHLIPGRWLQQARERGRRSDDRSPLCSRREVADCRRHGGVCNYACTYSTFIGLAGSVRETLRSLEDCIMSACGVPTRDPFPPLYAYMFSSNCFIAGTTDFEDFLFLLFIRIKRPGPPRFQSTQQGSPKSGSTMNLFLQ